MELMNENKVPSVKYGSEPSSSDRAYVAFQENMKEVCQGPVRFAFILNLKFVPEKAENHLLEVNDVGSVLYFQRLFRCMQKCVINCARSAVFLLKEHSERSKESVGDI